MRKLVAVVFLFAAAIIATAVWFSPLSSLGEAYAYENNAQVARLDGLCYPADAVCRVDFCGDIDALYSALDGISARVVKTTEAGGTVIVYAYSDRVCARSLETAEGERYNVMAACNGETVAVGTPLLSGSY